MKKATLGAIVLILAGCSYEHAERTVKDSPCKTIDPANEMKQRATTMRQDRGSALDKKKHPDKGRDSHHRRSL